MEAVGQVLAQRCLECGLLEIHSPYDVEQVPSKVTSYKKNYQCFKNLYLFYCVVDSGFA